jgi:hypothetical protein
MTFLHMCEKSSKQARPPSWFIVVLELSQHLHCWRELVSHWCHCHRHIIVIWIALTTVGGSAKRQAHQLCQQHSSNNSCCNKLFLKDCVYLRNAHQDDRPKIRFNIRTHTRSATCSQLFIVVERMFRDVHCTHRRLFHV